MGFRRTGGEDSVPLRALGGVGIVVVGSEAWALRKQVALLAKWHTPDATFWRGRFKDTDILVAQTAPGKVNAALATLQLLQSFRPYLMMSVGSAGAVDALSEGDVVIATEVGWHDVGTYLKNRFVPFGGFVHSPTRGRVLKDGFHLSESLELSTRSWGARRSAGNEGETAPLVWGKVVSGDQVVFSEKRKEFLRDELGALAVEMESAAVAQVASAWGVPWLAVRGISDTADGTTGFDFVPYARLMYGEGGALARLRALPGVLRVMLGDPGLRKKMGSIRHGLRVATLNATNVALALAVAPEVKACLQQASTRCMGRGVGREQPGN